MIRIVEEAPAHVAAREALLDRAFGPGRFLKTCERLREGRLPAEGLAFAMLDGSELVGTVRLWEVSYGQGGRGLMLGPIAIAEHRQGEGLGGQLIGHALERARALGHPSVILVGDAPYYARFGFSAEAVETLWMPGPVERERFLGLDLVPGALGEAGGFVLGAGRRRPQPELRELLAA